MIALLCHATGTGKTVTAVLDARRCGGRTLFLAHTRELIDQAARTFRDLWPEATLGRYTERIKQPDAHVVCGSVQSVALHLEEFKDNAFDYLIIDEAHHAAADTYQKVLAYFKPSFTLGLTATPERTDDRSILEIFKNTAHKLDIQTAVELGELTPVRCIRIHTNIDLTKVRFQQCAVQHPGSGDENLCTGAEPSDCRHLAPVGPGAADGGILRLRRVRGRYCGAVSESGSSRRCSVRWDETV